MGTGKGRGRVTPTKNRPGKDAGQELTRLDEGSDSDVCFHWLAIFGRKPM